MAEDNRHVEISGQMDFPTEPRKMVFDIKSIFQFKKLPSPIELIRITKECIRPWSEFLNTANFKSSASMPRLTCRFLRNLKYFQSNYIFISVVLMIYCLITSPLILIVLAAVAYGSHKMQKAQTPIHIFGQQLSTNYQILALNIASIPVLLLVGAGAALFWTLGASGFVISLHAMFYNIDAIVTEDTEGFIPIVV